MLIIYNIIRKDLLIIADISAWTISFDRY